MTLAGPDKGRKPTRASLDSLFDPHLIAVVGASRDPAKWGRRILEYTARAGFSGPLYGVNPGVADLNAPRVPTVAALSNTAPPPYLAVRASPASKPAERLGQCAPPCLKPVRNPAA